MQPHPAQPICTGTRLGRPYGAGAHVAMAQPRCAAGCVPGRRGVAADRPCHAGVTPRASVVTVTAVALVISPHFDDAVLSCGHWLHTNPGAVVATVCSGDPGPGIPASTGWDADAGFATASEATNARRAEDSAALAVLGSGQRLLGFLDNPYRVGRPLDENGCVEEAVAALLDELRPSLCLVPLGLLHPDHVGTGLAARAALRGRPTCTAVAYRDLPYAFMPDWPHLEAEARAAIQAEGVEMTLYSTALPMTDDAKRQAVGCYASQLPLLDQELVQRTLELGSERFWHLEVRR